MPEPTEQPKKLNYRQQRFIDEYVGASKGNAARAAREAGYSEKTAREIGRQLLTNLDIREAISERVSEYAMSPQEILAEYADIARNSSILPLLLDDEGALSLSLTDMWGERKPEARFIKSLRITGGPSPSLSVELYDRMAALDQLAKYHGLSPVKLHVVFEAEVERIAQQTDTPVAALWAEIERSAARAK